MLESKCLLNHTDKYINRERERESKTKYKQKIERKSAYFSLSFPLHPNPKQKRKPMNCKVMNYGNFCTFYLMFFLPQHYTPRRLHHLQSQRDHILKIYMYYYSFISSFCLLIISFLHIAERKESICSAYNKKPYTFFKNLLFK